MSTPIITIIEQEINTLIAAQTVANDYLLNWSPYVTFEDRALETSDYNCYATLEFLKEENEDEIETNFSDRMQNFLDYKLECRVPLAEVSTNNPQIEWQTQAHKAIADIKKQ